MKLLSRKPAPKVASRGDIVGGMSSLRIDEDEDSEEEARRRDADSLAERQRRAAQEREEKQRKYIEVRERLFGPTSRDTSQSPSASSTRTPATRDARQISRRSRPQNAKSSQVNSSAEQSPARATPQPRPKQLFDPNTDSTPRLVNSRDTQRSATPKEDQPVRLPKGPDGSGRGGFGFSARGGRAGV